MENTFLMTPYVGDDDDSLINLIRPLVALSFLKDVRSVSVNINEYIQKEEQIIKIELANGEEESEPSSYNKVEELDVDLDHSLHLDQPVTLDGNKLSTGRILPEIKHSKNAIIYNRKDSTADDVVPDDEDVHIEVIDFNAKPGCFSRHNQLSKDIIVSKQLPPRNKTSFHNPPVVQNGPLLHKPANSPKPYSQADVKKPDSFLHIEDMIKKQVDHHTNFNSMANFEDESKGEFGSRSANKYSVQTPKFMNKHNPAVAMKPLQLQSCDEIDEIIQRMNSTARKLI